MSDLGYFSTKPTLVGRKTILHPFTAADVARMAEILADPEVLRLTGSVRSTVRQPDFHPTLTEEERTWYETRHLQSDRLDLAVVDSASGECVGEVVLNELSEIDNSCGFRILLGPQGRDRGIGSEATRLIIDHAFSSTRLNRIELEVYQFNPRARHVYERAGFVFEGVKRSSFKFDDEYVDTVMMSILRSDRTD